MEYYVEITKSEPQPLETMWLEPESTVLSEIRQAQKDKSCMISLKCGLQNVHLTEFEDRIVVTKVERLGVEREVQCWVSGDD